MSFRNLALNIVIGDTEDRIEGYRNIRWFARKYGIGKAGALYIDFLKQESP